jgi:hypothetical protein
MITTRKRYQMTTNTYTVTEEICECFNDYALAITVTFDEEGFDEIPFFHNTLENLCVECLTEIQNDDSFFNVVVEPKLTLF